MTIRYAFVGAVALATLAGSTMASVTETSIFRQNAARARNGSTVSPTVDAHNNTNTSPGLFNDLQTASLPTPGAVSANASQNNTISNGNYFGSIHSDATAAGNPGGQCDSTTSYGAIPDNFQTTFSVGFTVDVATVAQFSGNAVATRTGSGGSILCQAILGDVLNGVPQPATLFAQPSANAPMVNWNQMITLLPGHSYSFTATTNASQSNTFSSNGGSSASTINFTIQIPAPGACGVLAMAGLVGLRRRR